MLTNRTVKQLRDERGDLRARGDEARRVRGRVRRVQVHAVAALVAVGDHQRLRRSERVRGARPPPRVLAAVRVDHVGGRVGRAAIVAASGGAEVGEDREDGNQS